MDPELLDADELAARLKVKVATIHTWGRRGWIPSAGASRRHVRFVFADVMDALRKRAEKTRLELRSR